MQVNSYRVPPEALEQHDALMDEFRKAMAELGCSEFEVMEQYDAQLKTPKGRVVQILRFRDRKHYEEVRQAEAESPLARELIAQLSELVDLPGQRAEGRFDYGIYMTPPEAEGSGQLRQLESPAPKVSVQP